MRAVSTIYVTYQLEFAIKAAYRVLDLFVAGLLPIRHRMARRATSTTSTGSRTISSTKASALLGLRPGAGRGRRADRLRHPAQHRVQQASDARGLGGLRVRARTVGVDPLRQRCARPPFPVDQGRVRAQGDPRLRRQRLAARLGRHCLHRRADGAADQARAEGAVAAGGQNAFGVTTPWQVVERMSQREFGITVNTVLHRTLAVETQTIMRIIADHHTVWSLNARQSALPRASGRRSRTSTPRRRGG